MSSELLRKSLSSFWFDGPLRTPNFKLRTNGCGVQTPNSALRTCGLTRRIFLRWLLGLSLLPAFPLSIRKTQAQGGLSPPHEERGTIAEFFKGEKLEYEIGFGFIKRVAVGSLTFMTLGKTGHYLAILQAETVGVLGWVARYRVDMYRSTMEEIDGGRCLRALSFEEDVKIGDKLRRKISLFDYETRKWIKVRRRKDGTVVRTEKEIPLGETYDDFLTASYNFRYGVYGEIERGKNYSVATFPQKGRSTYEVTVVGKEEEEGKRSLDRSSEGKEFFVKLLLGTEITHSKEGLIEGWLSKELYPLEGIIKDVFLFGDVRGTLINKTKG